MLGAFDGGNLVGTVTLLLDCPPNQPHRAEIAKLMTRISHRGRGVAKALIGSRARWPWRGANPPGARHRGRRRCFRALEGLGYTLAGVIPDYALKPHGGLTGTMIYWKRP